MEKRHIFMISNLLLPTSHVCMSRNRREPPSHWPAINHNNFKSPAFFFRFPKSKKSWRAVSLNGKISWNIFTSNARKMFHAAILAFINFNFDLHVRWCLKTRQKRSEIRERDMKKELKLFLCVSTFLFREHGDR